MCVMCIEFSKQRMSFLEVRRALGEMVITAPTTAERKHLEELAELDEEKLREVTRKFAEQHPEKPE